MAARIEEPSHCLWRRCVWGLGCAYITAHVVMALGLQIPVVGLQIISNACPDLRIIAGADRPSHVHHLFCAMSPTRLSEDGVWGQADET
eukprot:4646617-Amphidinium_carterae.1